MAELPENQDCPHKGYGSTQNPRFKRTQQAPPPRKGYGLRATGYGLRATGYGLRATGYGLRAIILSSLPGGQPSSGIPFLRSRRTISRLFVALILFFAIPQAEGTPGLAILPFTGGVGGDGEAVAAMLWERPEIRSGFTVIPLTPEAAAVAAEHRLQMGAFTDSDLAAGVGRMLGADYVLSGHLRRLGNRNLVIATLIRVDTLELVTGYYRTYRAFWEIRGFLPSMTESLKAAMRPRAGSLPTLAIAPLGITADPATSPAEQPDEAGTHGATDHDLETLAQILAIEIANSGEFAVLPRASVMRTALGVWETRMADERAAALERLIEILLGILDDQDDAGVGQDVAAVTEVGRAAAANYVLSVETRGLEGVTMFAARILRTEDGDTLAGADRGHRAIGEGVNRMAELALLLTDPDNAHERIAALDRERLRENRFGDPARFWSLGASAGSSFADPWLIGTLQGTASPLPFLFLRLGFDLGFVSGIDGAGYYSVYPFAHVAFFMPFNITPLPLWRGGVYFGAGGGLMLAEYRFDHVPVRHRIFLADVTVGIVIMDRIDVSYTLRTNLDSFNGRVSVGFTHRFGAGGR